MANPQFEHISMCMVKDVALVEILTKDLQGPKLAQELGAELGQVAAQEWSKRLLVDFHRNQYLSSTGFAVLFKLVKRAVDAGRQVKFCNMEPGVRTGAEIVGLDKLVEIYDSQDSALKAFTKG
jgi:anti-anti-sigma factor